MNTPRRSQAKGVALRDAVHQFIRGFGLLASDQTPCGHPLHLSEAHALLHLLARSEAEMPAPTQRELGDHLQIDKSNVSRLCRRLESKGYVRCKPCLEDARSKRITLTAKGKRLASAVDASSKARFAAVANLLQRNNGSVVKSLDELTAAITQIADEEC